MIPLFLHGGGEQPDVDLITFGGLIQKSKAHEDGKILLVPAAANVRDMEAWGVSPRSIMRRTRLGRLSAHEQRGIWRNISGRGGRFSARDCRRMACHAQVSAQTNRAGERERRT